MGYVIIHPEDNVKVSLDNGHKYAIRDINEGDRVIKYGFPIGIAYKDIKQGEHIHSHNLKTALRENENYEYKPIKAKENKITAKKISAYIRKDGRIGIRNDIWIVVTVGCVNKIAQRIADLTGAIAFTHPYGCSQLHDDHERTKTVLSSLIKHPNAGGVLVLGLGCENNNISQLKATLGDYDEDRVEFLSVQDCEDEIAEGVKIISKLKEKASRDTRELVDISHLKIGLKCGGSDGFSGITANPLCGRVTDRLTSMGATAVLTEVPEMFGAEKILMSRCENEEVFTKTVKLINDYKAYFIRHGEGISDNPSPGNKEGGITTLEEKSLGCVQKGGKAVITDVLNYGDTAEKSGLNLLDGPGNDMVAVTNLAAAGCQIILFTTGRGTPLGAPVPTIKIATNSCLAQKKKNWIDFDAQTGGEKELIELIKDICSGKETKNEENGYREIAIFKDGVTL